MGALGVAVAAVDLGMIYDEAKELVPEFQDLGNVINQASGFTRDLSEAGTALSTALTALTGSSTTTGDALKSIKDSTDIASQAVGVELKQSLLDAIPGFDGLYSAIFEVKSVIPTLTDVISELTGVWGKLPAPIQAAITKFQAQTDAQTQLSAGVNTLSSGIQKIIDATTKQNSAVQQATAVFNTLNTAYQGNKTLADGTVVTAQMVAAAHKTLAAAVSAATDAVKGHTAASGAEKDSLSAVNTAATVLVATYDQASTVYNKVVAAQNGSLQSQAALAIATKNLDAATKALYGDQNQLTSSGNAVVTADPGHLRHDHRSQHRADDSGTGVSRRGSGDRQRNNKSRSVQSRCRRAGDGVQKRQPSARHSEKQHSGCRRRCDHGGPKSYRPGQRLHRHRSP